MCEVEEGGQDGAGDELDLKDALGEELEGAVRWLASRRTQGAGFAVV